MPLGDGAATGRQTNTMALASRPDVVVLDIGLLDIDGNDVARELRRRLDDDCPAVVVVSGWGQEADRRRSAEAGFVRQLTKPVDPTAMSEVIGDVAPPAALADYERPDDMRASPRAGMLH